MKKLMAIVLALVLALSMVGCQQGAKDSKTLGVITISLDNDYCIQIDNGIKRAGEEKGYEVITCTTLGDAEQELASLDTLAASNAKAVYALALAGEAVCNQKTEKYPEIGIFMQGATPGCEAYLVEDNEGIAKMFIDSFDAFIAETGLTGGEIVCLFVAGSDNEDSQNYQAMMTIVNMINEHFSPKGFTMVPTYFPADTEEANNTMETALNAHPNARAFFCYNNDFAIAAANTITSAVSDTSQYFVFASEGDPTSLTYIADAKNPYRGCAMGDTEGTGYKIGLQLINYAENGKMENVAAAKTHIDWRNVAEHQN